MNHYVDQSTGELYAYDDEQVSQELVRPGLTKCPDRPSQSHAWKDGGWVLPVPAVPQSVTPLQGRSALRQQGFLAQVKTAVAAADEETQDAFEYATAWERDSPFVLGMAATLGWTDAEVDVLFILANSL